MQGVAGQGASSECCGSGGGGVSICFLSRGTEADKSRNSFRHAEEFLSEETCQSSSPQGSCKRRYKCMRQMQADQKIKINRQASEKSSEICPQRGRPFCCDYHTRGRFFNHNTLLDYSRLSLGLTFVPFGYLHRYLEFVIGFICGFTRTTCFHSRRSASIASSQTVCVKRTIDWYERTFSGLYLTQTWNYGGSRVLRLPRAWQTRLPSLEVSARHITRQQQ
jgi:hypothetical protein